MNTERRNDGLTVTLTITGMANHEWQGCLRMPNGTVAPFHSVLDLMKQLNRTLDREQSALSDAAPE